MTSWWRLWALEASWNRRSLQTAGWWVVLEPWVRTRGLEAGARDAVLRRHGDAANTNPVLAGLALGVLMRLEEDRDSSAGTTVQAMSRALGSQGDGLVWTGLRPLTALTGVLVAIWVSPVAALAVGLVYLLGQARLRWWCLEAGYEAGRDILDVLRRARFPERTATLRLGVGLLGGLALGVLAGGSAAPWPATAAALALGGAAARWRWGGTRMLCVWGILLWAASRLGG